MSECLPWIGQTDSPPSIPPSKSLINNYKEKTLKEDKNFKFLSYEKELPWDGTYLGILPEGSVIIEQEIRGNKYWRLDINGFNIICIIRTITSPIPCIIDEIKVLFGIPKLGTHYARYKNNTYILIKARLFLNDMKQEIVQEEETLKECQSKSLNTEKFKEKIIRMYTFRDTVGITKTYDSSIIVRWEKMETEEGYIRCEPYPISFYEPNVKLTEDYILPQTVLNKWFDEQSPGPVLKAMLKAYTEADLVSVVSRMRFSIARIIKNIDPDYIHLESTIIRRVSSRLTSEVTATPELVISEDIYSDDSDDSNSSGIVGVYDD